MLPRVPRARVKPAVERVLALLCRHDKARGLLQGKVSGQAPAGLYMMCFVEVKLDLVSYASRLDVVKPLTPKGLGRIPNSTVPFLRNIKP